MVPVSPPALSSAALPTMGAMVSALAIVVVGTLVARPAHAEPRTARLVYAAPVDAADGCPTEAAMRDRIAARLGYDPFVADAPRTLELGIRRERGGLRGGVALVDDDGRRGRERVYTEAAGACAELATTLALTAGLLVDPTAGRPKPDEARPAAPNAARVATPPAAGAPEPAPVARAAPNAPPHTVSGRVGGGVVGAVGSEPAPTLGFVVLGGLGTARWSVDLEGRLDLPRSTQEGGLAARLSLLAGTVAPCVRFGVGLVCALASGGALLGSARQGSVSQSRTSAWFALGPRLGLEVPLVGDLALRGHADVQAVLTRTTVDVVVAGATTTLWESPPVAAALGVGLVQVLR